MSALIQSVLNAVRPLIALADAGNVAATLTPVTAHTTSLLLELALLLGIPVCIQLPLTLTCNDTNTFNTATSIGRSIV